jgi:hypothetical protein
MFLFNKARAEEVVQTKPVAEDLSDAIEQAVARQPGEEVRSVRVFGDRYRCNWWVRERASDATFFLSTKRISRSSFVRATRSGDEVVIEDLTGR